MGSNGNGNTMLQKKKNMEELKGRVAIVVGGSRGIGREICLELASHGAAVVVCYQVNEEAAEEVVEMINQKKQKEEAMAKAFAVKCDVSSEEDVKAAFDAAEEAFGRINIVVNMAAQILTNYPYLAELKLEEWDRIMGINAKGTFLVLKEACKRVQAGGMGRIITASSTMHQILLPGYGAYVASKAVVETLTKIAAKELKGKKISVNCVSPGAVETDMLMAAGKNAEDKIERFKNMSIMGRIGTPHDIASLVAFLVSDAGEWINGQVIQANGGLAL